MRYFVGRLHDPRPELVVETVSDADRSFEDFRAMLLTHGCRAGLLFDQSTCIVLRNTYKSADEDSIVREATLPTKDLLDSIRVGSLEQRVAEWLRQMAADWDHTLPKERATSAPLLADIVPALSGAAITAVQAA